jgi:hypothetical protein
VNELRFRVNEEASVSRRHRTSNVPPPALERRPSPSLHGSIERLASNPWRTRHWSRGGRSPIL